MTRWKFVLCIAGLCGAAAFTTLAWTQDNPLAEPSLRPTRVRATSEDEPFTSAQPVPGRLGTSPGSPGNAPGFAPGGFPGAVPMRPRTVTRYVNEVIYEPVSDQDAVEAQKLQEAMHLLKTGTDEAAKKKATDAIQEQLVKQFERDLSQREKELAAVEERVKSLRQQLDKRKTAKGDIISLRLKTIINNAEGLGFPGEGGVPESDPYGRSSFNPVAPRPSVGFGEDIAPPGDFAPTTAPKAGGGANSSLPSTTPRAGRQ